MLALGSPDEVVRRGRGGGGGSVFGAVEQRTLIVLDNQAQPTDAPARCAELWV